MNKDQVKGTVEKAKGKVNEGVGKMTGDTTQTGQGPGATGRGRSPQAIWRRQGTSEEEPAVSAQGAPPLRRSPRSGPVE